MSEGESIYPTIEHEHHQNGEGIAYSYPLPLKGQQGLTKREYFVASILAGGLVFRPGMGLNYEGIAIKAVKMADAVIKELECSN